jgi:signal transduction protein with GAF and PtsI domain
MSANPLLNDVDIDFLHDISSRFAAEDPLHQDLERIIEFASAVVRCDSCFIYIREADELVLRASKNPHGEEVGRLKLALGQGITGWVAEHREPVAVSQHAWQDSRFRTFQELPEDSFEARQIRLVSMIGFLVGAEIEMARLEVENSELLQKLETRKLMERAKGILQRDLGLDEEQAYLTLQRQARQKRRTLKEIAEAVVLGEEIRKGSGSN